MRGPKLSGRINDFRSAAHPGTFKMSFPETISVVIPTLNEEKELSETLRRVRTVPEAREIIVADGGSSDATLEIAEGNGCAAVASRPGRGRQLRHGCATAKGDVILMLHADTWIDPNAGKAILNCFQNPRVVGGGLRKKFRGENISWLMAGGEFRCWVRLKLFGRVLGDQGIFVRREVLQTIGGVPEVPLMEEYELCKRLRREGRLVLANSTVTTSTRKFERLGVLRTYFLMAKVTLKYHLGTPLEELRNIYEKE